MNRRIVLIISLVCVPLFLCHAMDVNQLLEMYKNNQHKIKTIAAVGSLTMQMSKENGDIINNISSDISMYMKAPDLFKLVITSPVQSIMVQKGDIITQKIGSNPAMSQKAGADNNLFKKYFAYDLDDTIDASRILGQETITIEGKVRYKFTFEIPEEAGQYQGAAGGPVTAAVIFNEKGMVVSQVIYSGSTELVKSESIFIVKDSIYVTQQLKTTISSGGIIIVNTITYTAISINKEIPDKEFEIK